MEEMKKVVSKETNHLSVCEPLLLADTVLNVETNFECKITIHDKMVYSHVCKQSDWFKSKGNLLFESQDSIATALCFERKTVNRSIKKLESLGLLTKSKKRIGEVWKNTYSAIYMFGGGFRLFAEIESRTFNTKPVREVVEIVQSLEENEGTSTLIETTTPEAPIKPSYLTGAELLRQIREKQKVELYDYENDDTVIPY